MTISSDTRKAGPFNGNGVTTSFPFAFKVFATSDVQVIYTDADDVETTLVLDSDYTVSLNADQDANPGGDVTYSLLATGEKLTILGSIPYTQETDIQNQGGFYPEIIETALDKTTMLIQQVKEKVDRAVVVPPSSATTSEDYLDTLNTYKNEAASSASSASASASTATTKASEASTSADEAEADKVTIEGYLASLIGSAASSLIGFIQAGTGAVATTVQEELRRTVYVKQFGATGDGTTDDSAFVQAAIDTGATEIILTDGTYILEDLDLASYQRLVGKGNVVIKVKPSASANTLLFTMTSLTDVSFKNITFDGNTANITSFEELIRADDCSFIDFNECRWQNTRGVGVYFGNCNDSGVRNSKFYNVGAYNLISASSSDRRQAIAFSGNSGSYYRPYCDNNTFEIVGLDCVSMAKGTGDGAKDISIQQNKVKTSYAGSIYVSYADGGNISDNNVSNGSGGGNGIDCINSINLNIDDNTCHKNGATGILLADCKFINGVGNKCYNNWQGGTSLHRGGITLSSSSSESVTDINLSGNQCYDTQGASVTQRYAIGVYTTGAGSYRRINIDQSNRLLGYTAGGVPDNTAVVQVNTALGITGYPMLFNLAAGAEVILYTASQVYGEFSVFQTSNSAYGKFFARHSNNVLELLDPSTQYDLTDTGTTNAIYYDAGSNTVRLRNRQAVTRSYCVSTSNWLEASA